MAGKQAKILSDQQIKTALKAVRSKRHPDRNRVIFLLSTKAGLRAGEIANLTWPMVCDADGRVSNHIELHDDAAKKGSGPHHPSSSPVKIGFVPPSKTKFFR
jgi:integrase